MEKIKITCTNNGKTKQADVIQKNDKHLKVVVEGCCWLVAVVLRTLIVRC